MPKKARLTGGYYGTRRADYFPERFVRQAAAGAAFSDITAGTGQFPYRMATERGKPVVLVERCPYVGYLLRSVFEGQAQTSKLARDHKLPRGRTEGYLSGRADLVGRVFSAKMAARIDFLAQQAKEHQDGLLSHCIGRAICSTFTYRTLNWSSTLAKGGSSTAASVEEFEARVLAAAADVLVFQRAIDPQVMAASSVFLGDTVKLAPKIAKSGAFKDAVVYADPAWPWSKDIGNNDNPYAFTFEQVSSVIEQKQLALSEVWTRDNGDRIKSELLGWVAAAFEGGAKTFVACTQDTNYPHPNAVRQWFVDAGYNVATTMVLHDRSMSANREYLNYWFWLEKQ